MKDLRLESYLWRIDWQTFQIYCSFTFSPFAAKHGQDIDQNICHIISVKIKLGWRCCQKIFASIKIKTQGQVVLQKPALSKILSDPLPEVLGDERTASVFTVQSIFLKGRYLFSEKSQS